MLLALSVFVQANGIGALFPLLARIQTADHLPTWGLGVMSGASFFATLAAQVAVSRLLDGPRARLVLLGGLVLAVAGPLWFSLAGSLAALTAARAASGAAYAVVMPAALRAGSVGIEAARRGHRLGLLSSAQMAGIVTGPLVGVGFYAVGGLAAPFQLIAVASAVLFLAVLVVPSAGAVPEPDPDPGAFGAAGTADRPKVSSPAVVAILLLAVAVQLPSGLYDALWSRLMTDRGASTALIGLSLALFGLPFIALAPLGGRLAGRRAPFAWTAGAVVVCAGFLASYGLVASPVVIVVLGLFEASAQAVVVPGGYATVAVVFPDRWAATGQGWFAAAGTAAAGLASVGGASLYAAFGPGVVFVSGAATCLACTLAALVPWRIHQRLSGHQLPEERFLLAASGEPLPS